MNGIIETAVTFVKQAAKYSDPALFDIPEAFDLLCNALDQFAGAHFESVTTRQHLAEAINLALSSIPGNQVSVRFVELSSQSYALEWLPYTKLRPLRLGGSATAFRFRDIDTKPRSIS